MASRKLIPSTIIPPELYVQREADRQLRRLMNDTGRPGCILVARQMGKTNLLLNAKRELENDNNAFIYVDLSVALSSDRECFRHIIDIALDSENVAFQRCRATILRQRESVSAAPYKEHEFELRTLLASILGKLVIILDEIDSLAKVDFSDRIFAQIRSIYFTRVNYPQFNRLTYVLSGVLEPNEIIKDKRISPFNIAEKIYIDDFDADEHNNFICRSGLQLKDEVADRIYYWAHGNPRITWDICADLEDKLFRGYFLTVDEVDQTVQKLYLKDFNQAPIDHIREMVANNDDLRHAVVAVKANKGEVLHDEVKNKLYLAGICTSVRDGKGIKIKNRVVDAAMSDQWLHNIGVQRKGLMRLADERFFDNDFEGALEFYKDLYRKGEFPEQKSDLAYYRMGVSAYRMANYSEAIEYLELFQCDKEESSSLYYERKSMLGSCYLAVGDLKNCRTQYDDILEYNKKDERYISAMINIASSYAIERDNSMAMEIYEKVLGESAELKIDGDQRSRFLAATYVNLGVVVYEIGDIKRARQYFESAVNVCLPEQKPAILLKLVELAKDRREAGEISVTCAQYVIQHRLRPVKPDPQKSLAFGKAHLLGTLIACFEHSRSTFQLLFDYAMATEGESKTSSELLFQLAMYSIRQGNRKGAAQLAKSALVSSESSSRLSSDDEFNSLRLLCMVTGDEKRRPYIRQFVDLLKSGVKPKVVAHIDINIMATEIADCIERRNLREGLELVALAKRNLTNLADDELGGFAIIYFFEMSLLKMRFDTALLKKTAEECLNFIDSLPRINGSELVLGQNGLKEVRSFAEAQLKGELPPIKNAFTEKYKRNDKVSVRYSDGTVKEAVKFKKVEVDLINGLCVLIESHPKIDSNLNPL